VRAFTKFSDDHTPWGRFADLQIPIAESVLVGAPPSVAAGARRSSGSVLEVAQSWALCVSGPPWWSWAVTGPGRAG